MITFRGVFIVLLVVYGHAVTGQSETSLIQSAIDNHQSSTTALLIPRKNFLSPPRIDHVKLSPDGLFLVYSINDGSNSELHLMDTTTKQSQVLFSTTGLSEVIWSRDSQIVYLELANAVGYLQLDAPGRPGYITTLDRDNGDVLLRPDSSSEQAVLISRPVDNGTHLLQRYTLNGEESLLFVSNDIIRDALLVPELEYVLVQTESMEAKQIVRLTSANTSSFINLLTCPLDRQCDMLEYNSSDDRLYLSSNRDSDLIGLYALTRSSDLILLHEDPEGITDLVNVSFSASQPRIVYYIHDKGLSYGLDEITINQLAQIPSLLPSTTTTISTPASGNGNWLIEEIGPKLSQPRYHLYSPESRFITEILIEEKHGIGEIPQTLLAEKIAVSYPADDGRLIHGFITLPNGLDLDQSPLLTHVHGGPIARIDGFYSSYSQFLANRGYIVFEPNFRGSAGYGVEFISSSNKDWGDGIVQQDIVNGIQFLLGQGIGDPDRLGILGGSFGGFSTLAGLAFTPDLFEVGVALLPVTDLSITARNLRTPERISREPASAYTTTKYFLNLDEPEEIERLYQQSPMNHLEAITSPLLLLAGADDDRVPIAHVKDYSLKLVNMDKPVALLIDEDMGHGFNTDIARLANLFLTEKFLSLTLGGRSEPLDDPELAHYIKQKLLINNVEGFESQLNY